MMLCMPIYGDCTQVSAYVTDRMAQNPQVSAYVTDRMAQNLEL